MLDWMASKLQGCPRLHLPPLGSPPTHLLCFPDSGNETEVFTSPTKLHLPLFTISCGLSMVSVFWLSVHCPCDLLAKVQSVIYHSVSPSSPDSCLSFVPYIPPTVRSSLTSDWSSMPSAHISPTSRPNKHLSDFLQLFHGLASDFFPQFPNFQFLEGIDCL